METIILIAVVGTLNLACFLIGAKVGQAVANGKEIETPVIKSPMEAVREIRSNKEARKEMERIETIISNVERYDGTANGQEDVPRG